MKYVAALLLMVGTGWLAGCEGPTRRPVAAAGPAAPTPDSLHLLAPGRVGPLRLNMKESVIQTLVPAAQLRRTTRQLEGIDYPVLEMQDPAHPTAAPLLLELAGNDDEGYRLWRVRVQSPHYRTAEGVGVGSPVGLARSHYGINTVELADAGLVAVSDDVKMTWVLAADSQRTPPRQPAQLNPATLVRAVLLFR